MTFMTYRSKRWLALWLQAAVMITLPFIRIRGESALRFDVPTLKLYFFGSAVWISEAYFFLLVFLLFAVGVMLFTVLYGRIWCGWACPQTTLSDLARTIEKLSSWMSARPAVRRALSHGLLLLFSCLVAVTLVGYFVSPYDILNDVLSRSIGPWTFWSWIFFSSLIYLNLAFVRQRFCSDLCPYARFQSAFFDDHTLTIAFDRSRENECMGCEACVRTCPAGIDIRDGIQIACINCAECVDSCSLQRQRYGKDPLVRYTREIATRVEQQGMRPRVLWLSLLFAVMGVMLVYQIAIRVPVDFWVLRDAKQPYHQVGVRGSILNAYDLIIENRSLAPETYQLSVSGIKNAELVLRVNPFTIPANSSVTMRIYVFAPRKDLAERVTRLSFTLINISYREIRAVQEAPFVYPERSDKVVDI
jgi:cytochrome c oxidase accessory protein FixG